MELLSNLAQEYTIRFLQVGLDAGSINDCDRKHRLFTLPFWQMAKEAGNGSCRGASEQVRPSCRPSWTTGLPATSDPPLSHPLRRRTSCSWLQEKWWTGVWPDCNGSKRLLLASVVAAGGAATTYAVLLLLAFVIACPVPGRYHANPAHPAGRRYWVDDVCGFGEQLSKVEEPLERRYVSLQAGGPNTVEVPDNDVAFITGNFGSDIGIDLLGIRETGLAERDVCPALACPQPRLVCNSYFSTVPCLQPHPDLSTVTCPQPHP